MYWCVASGEKQRSAVQLTPPSGLKAETISAGGDSFVLFSWNADTEAPQLSEAEQDVLLRVANGESNRDIARARGVSPRTVANQVASLLRKLNASSRYEIMSRFGK
jgi:DNA-binding NarL/FixJ family response regulator